MKDGQTSKRGKTPERSVFEQVLEFVDWASRHSTSTAEQKEAVELKEKLEQWHRDRALPSSPLATAA